MSVCQQPISAPSHYPANTSQGDPFQQQFSDLFLFFFRDGFAIDFHDEFSGAASALIILFPVIRLPILLIIPFATPGTLSSDDHHLTSFSSWGFTGWERERYSMSWLQVSVSA